MEYLARALVAERRASWHLGVAVQERYAEVLLLKL
jgi:hypothetical protein